MTNASHALTFIHATTATQQHPDNTECSGECAFAGEVCGGISGVSCKATRRRLFIERKRRVEDRVETILVLVKSKPGGQTELRRRSAERRQERCAILSARRRAEEEAARDAIEEAFQIDSMGSKRKQPKRSKARTKPALAQDIDSAENGSRKQSRQASTKPPVVIVRLNGKMTRRERYTALQQARKFA